jgi:hypothetical protein
VEVAEQIRRNSGRTNCEETQAVHAYASLMNWRRHSACSASTTSAAPPRATASFARPTQRQKPNCNLSARCPDQPTFRNPAPPPDGPCHCGSATPKSLPGQKP